MPAGGAPPAQGNPSNSPQTAVQQGEGLRGAISPAKAKRPMQNILPAQITGSRTMPTQA